MTAAELAALGEVRAPEVGLRLMAAAGSRCIRKLMAAACDFAAAALEAGADEPGAPAPAEIEACARFLRERCAPKAGSPS